jgi:hypothetical protein
MDQDAGEAVQDTEGGDRGSAPGPIQMVGRELVGRRDVQPPACAGDLRAGFIDMQDMRGGPARVWISFSISTSAAAVSRSTWHTQPVDGRS